MVTASANFTLTASNSGSLVVPPLPNATAGAWSVVPFNGHGINLPYCLLKPFGFNAASSTTYPLFVYLHENGYGNDQSGNFVLYNYESQGQGGDIWFNLPVFRSNYPCFVIVPMLDESADQSGNTVNWGGWGGTNPQPSQLCVVDIVKNLLATQPIHPKHVYVTGDSLGGIGTWEHMIQYNAYNGLTTGSRLFAAGWSESGGAQLYSASTVATQLKSGQVPLFVVRGAGDGSTAPAWGNAVYTAAGGVNNQQTWPPPAAPSSKLFYINDPNLDHDTWGLYRNLSPQDLGSNGGGATTRSRYILDWLFAQVAP